MNGRRSLLQQALRIGLLVLSPTYYHSLEFINAGSCDGVWLQGSRETLATFLEIISSVLYVISVRLTASVGRKWCILFFATSTVSPRIAATWSNEWYSTPSLRRCGWNIELGSLNFSWILIIHKRLQGKQHGSGVKCVKCSVSCPKS